MHHGMHACGFGPIVWTIVYFFLDKNGVVELLSVEKVVVEILAVSILAFIAGGINSIYKIEKLPLMAAIFIHGIVLYLDYVIIYLFNGWLDSHAESLLVFTVCFVAGFSLIWTVIYFVLNRNTNQMNQKLSQLQNRSHQKEK